MRLSKMFGRPSKTEGTDYTIVSHRLLTQAGFIRESTAGRYFMLPLGVLVQNKIIDVVRKHMNRAGVQEVLMPTLHPLELWKETNRTTSAGFELMKITDRREAEFALGGTAEEMAVDLVRKFNISYRDLPLNIYQFSMKFRDELRARGGLLRVREFIMKDAYSFSTEEQFKTIYKMYEDTYKDIFAELGLKVDVVAADNGYIGGEYCHEFAYESEVGETRYFIDEKTGYAAHEDVAKVKLDDKNLGEALKDLEEVDAKRGTTMEAGAKLHGLPMWQQIKDVLFFDESTKRYILAIIRGDLDVNETKLMQVAGAWEMRPATEAEIREDLESEPGFISPVGIRKKGKKSGHKLVVVADASLRTIVNAYGGTNKRHRDLLNINFERDYTADLEADIALAQPGMLSPVGGKLIERRGIEVGNIFQLGHHYSNLMSSAEFTDNEGRRQKYYMGSYGIGIGRTLAAIVEAYHDDKGIIWPAAVAPAQVHIVRLGVDEAVVKAADELYSQLTKAGHEVLYDDRDAPAGAKFADADLIGAPLRLTVSKKTLEQDSVEVKFRAEEDSRLVKMDELDTLLR